MKISKHENNTAKPERKMEAPVIEKAKNVGAVSQEQIDAWKREYGKVFRSVIGKDVVIWRRLKRSEYITAMTAEDLSEDPEVRIYQRQESVLKAVCLYPSNIDELIESEGCLATNLGGEIMDCSGFAMPKTDEI
jgi:hypothetical protein